MAKAHLDGSQIRDWNSFHDISARELGFPAFYGRNLDAWIDCLTYLDDPDGMSRFSLEPGEVLELELTSSKAMEQNAPDVLKALVETVGFVNKRYEERGKPPMLRLVLK
jgi:hypothetical protein